jgi:hypothetical protein
MRAERLLPMACLAAALMLGASELMVTFEFTPPGGEALAQQDAADRHYYAPLVLAVFAIAALGVTVSTGSKPAAAGVAIAGAIALLIFLIVDLPDANNVGTLDDPRQSFFSAEALPQAGFWVELIGALGLTLSGAALATMSQEQLNALRPRWLERRQVSRNGGAAADPEPLPLDEPFESGRAARRAAASRRNR